MDRALLRVVTEAFETLPEEAGTLRHKWVEPAGMWFVDVRPRLATAAQFGIGYDPAGLLNVSIGNIWFEVPATTVEDLEYAKELAAAVFAGRVEESGPKPNARGRILLDSGESAWEPCTFHGLGARDLRCGGTRPTHKPPQAPTPR